ncbi:MAG TPA: hypothetical protein VH419_01885, partial [Nocardioidaceae bacterium]
VGGLPVAVADGVSGALVEGHDVDDWAAAIDDVLQRDPGPLSVAAAAHAAQFSWGHTVDALLNSYAHAMSDYRSRHRRPGRRPGRRFALRRGVRA